MTTSISPSTLPDLQEVVGAVEIVSPTQFRIGGLERSVPPAPPPAEEAQQETTPLLAALEKEMYALLYCRTVGGGNAGMSGNGFVDELQDRQFVAALSQANTGRGCWEPGWILQGFEEDGRIPVHKDGLTLWVTPAQLRSRHDSRRPGRRCRIRVGKELRELMPGFYFAIGDGDERDERDEDDLLVRLYWNLRPSGAAVLIGALTSTLNRSQIPFRAKVVSYQAGYGRADSGVLYCDKRYYTRLFPLLPAVHDQVVPHLGPEVPRFTKRLAPGVGLAEDPGGNESFGQHRCQLISRALWQAHVAGHHDLEARCAHVVAGLREAGLDPEYLYLRPRSQDDYGTLGEPLNAPPPIAVPQSSQPAELRPVPRKHTHRDSRRAKAKAKRANRRR